MRTIYCTLLCWLPLAGGLFAKGDTLHLPVGTGQITLLWENGQLFLRNTADEAFSPLDGLYENPGLLLSSNLRKETLPATPRTAACQQWVFSATYPSFTHLRILRVYAELPVWTYAHRFKGNWPRPIADRAEEGSVENPALLNQARPFIAALPLPSRHCDISIVQFQDQTDHYNNLVQTVEGKPYAKPFFQRGSIALIEEAQTGETAALLKCSPLAYAQPGYPGYDFSFDYKAVQVHGLGLDESLPDTLWTTSYELLFLAPQPDRAGALGLLKAAQLMLHRYLPAEDATFFMNTWGDRNRDSRVGGKFLIEELRAAARLGVRQYQIDDGWQQGLSKNAASKTGQLWEDWQDEDWAPHPERFPNGLGPVLDTAAAYGIELALWFNPSQADDYRKWARDAGILRQLNDQYGIRWFKIDGLQINNAIAQHRINSLLSSLNAPTGPSLQFNLDLTAGKRGGYFYWNHFGNLFLENRYTDWGNYYPHLALRNAWQLAHYLPVQRLQLEFLNKWRNPGRYPAEDPLKPSALPFDYLFATTMAGQPLAWMEATGLPDSAFAIRPLVEAWAEVRDDMQSGIIHPIGQTPSGFGFTGFVSYGTDRLYFLLFREQTGQANYTFTLPAPASIEGKVHLLWSQGGRALMQEGRQALHAEFSQDFEVLFGYFD